MRRKKKVQMLTARYDTQTLDFLASLPSTRFMIYSTVINKGITEKTAFDSPGKFC